MDTMLVLLTLLTAAAARNVPTTDFVPSVEQLDSIFNPPSVPQPTTTLDPPEEPPGDPHDDDNNKHHHKKDTKDNGSKVVEVNVRINVGDCDKQDISINETIKVNHGTKHANHTKHSSSKGKDDEKVNTNFVDRVAFVGDACPAGHARVGTVCVPED